MGDAKRIEVKPIARADAAKVIRALHYSHRSVVNSKVHLGIFLDGKCGGALQFGPSISKRNLQGLVAGTKWHEFIELNRFAMAPWMPRNGESRALGYSMRWLRKTYPWLKWVVSFADGTQCGDGTIYRASGFLLTQIRKNTTLWRGPKGDIVSDIGMRVGKTRFIAGGGNATRAFKAAGYAPLPGFQLRYIYFLDPAWRSRLTVPVLPFDEIAKRGAGMYRGKRRGGRSETVDTPGVHPGEGGSTPTLPLQPAELKP